MLGYTVGLPPCSGWWGSWKQPFSLVPQQTLCMDCWYSRSCTATHLPHRASPWLKGIFPRALTLHCIAFLAHLLRGRCSYLHSLYVVHRLKPQITFVTHTERKPLIMIDQNPSSHPLSSAACERQGNAFTTFLHMRKRLPGCKHLPFNVASLPKFPLCHFEDLEDLTQCPGSPSLGKGASQGVDVHVQVKGSSVAQIKWRSSWGHKHERTGAAQMPWSIHQTIPGLCFLGWKFWEDGRQIQALAGTELPFIQAPAKEEFLHWCWRGLIFPQLQNLQFWCR